MRAVIALVLIGYSYAFSNELRAVQPIIPENYTAKGSDNLGICFGASTNWQSYPYTVALRYTSGSACCSGSILSLNPGVLVTAAHCNGCTGQVRIGCNNPENCDGDSYGIDTIIQNPSYGSPLQFSNDIAIVRLQTPITTPGAQAMNIPDFETTIGEVRVVGYGITQSGTIPTTLQTMQSNIIERSQCQSLLSTALGGGQYVDDSMICIRSAGAGAENVPTMCSGDSGGPITVGNNEYGVNSWVLQGGGTGCNSCNCCPGYPQVAANVAHSADWLRGYLNAWKQGDLDYVWEK